MESNISRLQAESDLRSLSVLLAAQGKEQCISFSDRLVREMGSAVITESVLDREAVRRLKAKIRVQDKRVAKK